MNMNIYIYIYIYTAYQFSSKIHINTNKQLIYLPFKGAREDLTLFHSLKAEIEANPEGLVGGLALFQDMAYFVVI